MANQDPNEGGADKHPDRSGRPFFPRLRTDTEEADYNSSDAVQSTPQSVDDYMPDEVHPTREDDTAVIAWTGQQFDQSPVSTPPRDRPTQSPSPRHSARIVIASIRSNNVAQPSNMDNDASARSERGFKRRGSDLEEPKNGRRNPQHRYTEQQRYRATIGTRFESADHGEVGRAAERNDMLASPYAGLTEIEEDGDGDGDDDDTDSFSEDEYTHGDRSDIHEDDSEGPEESSTPKA